jgi:hypothetical protein
VIPPVITININYRLLQITGQLSFATLASLAGLVGDKLAKISKVNGHA